MSRILVVDDELSMREVLEIFFANQGHQVDTAADGAAGIARLHEEEYDLVITDLRMPRTHGMVVLEQCRALFPETPVIVMTAYASAETAIKAMKMGAYDYFTKPFKLDEVKVVIDKALERRSLVRENQQLRAELGDRARRPGGIIGRSRAMQQVFDLVRRVARTRTNVLILGESGTGKELVAQALHEASDRADKPFLVVNCAAIPEHLLESELFGHRRGTFTGATHDTEGLFRAAHGGTLLLDEIGEMPLGMQVKLLRVLQERKIKAVGDVRETSVDVRVIAATNRDLATEVRAGRFREDLYYRLNVICIELPPLRDRPTDIPLLAHFFMRKYSKAFDKHIAEITPDAIQCLLRYDYSGNVRELENLIERAVALEEGSTISERSLPAPLRSPTAAAGVQEASTPALPAGGIELETTVEDFERGLIEQALERTSGRKKEAARLLGISFRSLRYRLEKLKMRDDSRDEE